MAKKVSILEDVSRHFRQVQYLRTPQTGGGEVLWAPEDERQLMQLTVTKNGLYKASDYLTNKDIPYWGFSQAVVNVQNAGMAIGIKPTDGNEYCVEVDENGDLDEHVLPSRIEIVTQPTKTEYDDGEDIDITGMVVKAYKNDNDLWTDEDYPTGIIPLNEITFTPTKADAAEAHVEHGQQITVKWNRPYDQKELTDNFKVTVQDGSISVLSDLVITLGEYARRDGYTFYFDTGGTAHYFDMTRTGGAWSDDETGYVIVKVYLKVIEVNTYIQVLWNVGAGSAEAIDADGVFTINENETGAYATSIGDGTASFKVPVADGRNVRLFASKSYSSPQASGVVQLKDVTVMHVDE